MILRFSRMHVGMAPQGEPEGESLQDHVPDVREGLEPGAHLEGWLSVETRLLLPLQKKEGQSM